MWSLKLSSEERDLIVDYRWLMGVNVGSEALYRKEIKPDVLAGYIYDVKGMTQIAYKATHAPVGSADTWTSWVDGANKPVIDASDVILMNAFPVCFRYRPSHLQWLMIIPIVLARCGS